MLPTMRHSSPHHPDAAASHATHVPARAREAAFTLLEIVVVLVIIALIMGAGLSTLRGTKAQTQTNKARSVAIQLGEAVQQFQRDHGGRPPTQPASGNADWNPTFTSPIDRSNPDAQGRGKPYARGASVEALATGAVTLENRSGSPMVGSGQRASTTARVRYIDDQNRGIYALVAFADRGQGLKVQCYVSNASTSTVASLVRPLGIGRPC